MSTEPSYPAENPYKGIGSTKTKFGLASLIRSIIGMNCKNSIYVGDSMEDFIMAKKATEEGKKTTFCGIIGTSKNPLQKLELFEKNGARLVLDSIELLPKVLNLEWGKVNLLW